LLSLGGNAISLRRIFAERLEATRQCLPGQIAFAKHDVRADQLDPSLRVARRSVKGIDSPADSRS